MPIKTKSSEKGSAPANAEKLQKYIDGVKSGKTIPFREKTERARQNLKRAGLIK